MPIYEYQCEACGQILDALQKIADAPLKKCPNCGKAKLKRLLSAPMFLLKGSGWYETDFKSDKERRRNLADRPDPDAKPADGKADAPAVGKAGESDAKPGASDAKAGASDVKAGAKSDDKKERKDSVATAGRKAVRSGRSHGTSSRAAARGKSRPKPKSRRR